jgi:hypothetical protein
LIVAANRPVAYQAIAKAPRDLSAAERADIERRCAGATHAEFAAYLLGLWGLPDKIVEAVAYHHAPLAHIGPAIGCDGALLAVHIANALVDADPSDPLRGLDSGLTLHPLVTAHQAEWIAAAKSLQT